MSIHTSGRFIVLSEIPGRTWFAMLAASFQDQTTSLSSLSVVATDSCTCKRRKDQHADYIDGKVVLTYIDLTVVTCELVLPGSKEGETKYSHPARLLELEVELVVVLLEKFEADRDPKDSPVPRM